MARKMQRRNKSSKQITEGKMTKLKTIEDFEIDYKERLEKINKRDFFAFQASQWVHERLHLLKELKAEAVKWYKEFSKRKKMLETNSFIWNFFNLTEKDLEEKE